MCIFIMSLQEGSDIGSISQIFLVMEYFVDETPHNIYLTANVQRIPWVTM